MQETEKNTILLPFDPIERRVSPAALHSTFPRGRHPICEHCWPEHSAVHTRATGG
jgi:hypothetical protein